MAKKVWVVMDSGFTHSWETKRTFPNKADALEYATEQARGNEEDYYVFEAVSVVSTPKMPVQVIDLAA